MRGVSKAALVFWLWGVLPLAVAGEAMHDPVLQLAPKAVQKVCAELFPAHRVLRVVERQAGGAPVYRITVFSLTDMAVQGEKTGNDIVNELMLHHLELTADGKVLEESRHRIPESRVPKAVLDGFRLWNPNGVKGMGVFWTAEQAPGKERVFSASVILSSVKNYSASFGGNGSVVVAEPVRVP
jgi:hypothetical protein